ncbi:hypothetical protein [Companilactobacillus furfuricola]|uniref:hypothetical protein n=1 Tax=Companilactobacillus furfuricola TaxID=1462575 RepID=UPI0013DE75D3|nr:hypothetical protein [Companilactobacillus furfuricola]
MKDPALKQASGLLDWFKVASMAFHGAIPGTPTEPAMNHHPTYTLKKNSKPKQKSSADIYIQSAKPKNKPKSSS